MRLLSGDKATQLTQGTTVQPGSVKWGDTAVRPHTDHDYCFIDLSTMTIAWCNIIHALIILQSVNSWLITTIKPHKKNSNMLTRVVRCEEWKHDILCVSISDWAKLLNNGHKNFLLRYAFESERFFQCHSPLIEEVEGFKDLIKGAEHMSFSIHFHSLSFSLLNKKTVLEYNASKYFQVFIREKTWHLDTFCVCVCVVCVHVRYRETVCVCVSSITHSFSQRVRRSVHNTGTSCCPITKGIWVIISRGLTSTDEVMNNINLFPHFCILPCLSVQ